MPCLLWKGLSGSVCLGLLVLFRHGSDLVWIVSEKFTPVVLQVIRVYLHKCSTGGANIAELLHRVWGCRGERDRDFLVMALNPGPQMRIPQTLKSVKP